VVSSYGPSDVTFTPETKDDEKKLLEKVFTDKARKAVDKNQGYAKEGQPQCVKGIDLDAEEGYGYFYYHNESQKTLKETIHFQDFGGLTLVSSGKGDKVGDKVDVVVKPKEEKLILLKRLPNIEHISAKHTEDTKFI